MTSIGVSGDPPRASVLRTVVTAAAFLLAGWLLYKSLRGVDWRSVYLLIAGAKLALLALGCVLSSTALLLRAIRWRVLLEAEGTVRLTDAFWATAAGYFGNNFLPGRAGELVRTFIVSSCSKLSAAYVLTTALAERTADAFALLLIGGVVLLEIPAPPGWLTVASKPVGVIALGGIGLILLLPRLYRWFTVALDWLPMPASMHVEIIKLLEQVVRGIQSFHNLRRLLVFIALTATIWCMDATGLVIGGYALGLPISYPLAFLLCVGLGLGSALPSTPGYIGIYQFVAVSVLTPFGWSRSDAIGYILLVQTLSYVVYGIWGSLGLVKYGAHRRLNQTREYDAPTSRPAQIETTR